MKAISLTAVIALVAAVAAPAAGEGNLRLEMKNGRVTLEAQDVPPSQILAEWARVGRTKIVNGERVPGGPITLQLVDVPEAKALDAVLRSVAGYLAAPRATVVPDASVFDRILVLAKPRQAAAPAVAMPQPAQTVQRFRGQMGGRQVDDQGQTLTPEPAPGETNPNMPPNAQPGYPTPGFPSPPDPGANPAMPPAQGTPAPGVPGGMVPAGSSPIPGVIVQPKPPVKPPGAPDRRPYRQ